MLNGGFNVTRARWEQAELAQAAQQERGRPKNRQHQGALPVRYDWPGAPKANPLTAASLRPRQIKREIEEMAGKINRARNGIEYSTAKPDSKLGKFHVSDIINI